jgi:hypothetical protein
MIRVLFLFVILFILIYLGILGVQKITGQQFFKLTKIAGYVIISSMLAIMLMFGLVILF